MISIFHGNLDIIGEGMFGLMLKLEERPKGHQNQ